MTSDSVSGDEQENQDISELINSSSDGEPVHHTLKVSTYYNKKPEPHRSTKLYRPRTAAPVGPYLRKGTGILASTVRRSAKNRDFQDQKTSPERWVFDKECNKFLRQTESWERIGKEVKKTKVYNPDHIIQHPDHIKEQHNLEMVRDQFLTLRNHRNLKPPEKENTKLVDDLELKAFGLDDSRKNKLHMRNINE